MLTNRKRKGGRARSLVAADDLVCEPDEAMLALIHMKNDGRSWRSLAAELGGAKKGISHNLVRLVALGYCKSERVEIALGLRKHFSIIEVKPCSVCGKVHAVEWCTEIGPPATKGRPKSDSPRIRIAADVSSEQRSRLHQLASGLGHSWTSLCQSLADGALCIKENHGGH